LNTAGAAVAGASPGLQLLPAQAASTNLLGFEVDLGFLDTPPPKDVAKPPADAVVTPSGLAYKVLLRPACALSSSPTAEQLAKCQKAQPYDKVVVDYTGWQANGRMFDTSRLEKKSLVVNDVMPGLTEVLQLMSPGETRRVWIPSSLAYGDNPKEKGRPAGPVTFDIELFSIQPQPKPPEAPQDVAAPPADAVSTPSGLAYKVIKSGSGSKKPKPESKITVSYSGWRTSGNLFMSSVLGAPTTFPVKEIPLAGLAEGVQLMVEGETRRFWIPAALALGDKKDSAGLPMGMLVFELELKGIE